MPEIGYAPGSGVLSEHREVSPCVPSFAVENQHTDPICYSLKISHWLSGIDGRTSFVSHRPALSRRVS
jgi:hypothetical protein